MNLVPEATQPAGKGPSVPIRKTVGDVLVFGSCTMTVSGTVVGLFPVLTT